MCEKIHRLTLLFIQLVVWLENQGKSSEKDKNAFSIYENVDKDFPFVIGTPISMKSDMFFPRSEKMNAFPQK